MKYPIFYTILLILICLSIQISSSTEDKDSDLASYLLNMKQEHILESDSLFFEIYYLTSNKPDTIYAKQVFFKLYNMKDTAKEYGIIYLDNVPRNVIVINSLEKEIKLPVMIQWDMKQVEYIVPNTIDSILCVKTPYGGNGWNDNPYTVISLQTDNYLKDLGKISNIEDVDNDGFDELINYENIWESGLGLLCHASSPSINIIMDIKGEEIKPDIESHKELYKNEIDRIDFEIKNYSQNREDGENLLKIILQKFLIYRLLGETDTAWEEFDKDIMHYDNEFFFLYSLRKPELDKISIKEIKGKIEESLE
jgi:hypothetical protein